MLARLMLILIAVGISQTVLNTSAAYSQEQEKWTSPDGKEVTGEFVRMEGKAVVLKLATGREVRVPLSSLSLESHLQALKLAKPEAFSKELIRAPVVIEPIVPTTLAPVTSIMDFPFGEDPTIDQFLKIAIGEWKRGNNFVVWHMLPPRMQQDIAMIISDSINTLGTTGTTTFRNTFAVLASLASKKRDWIVGTDLEKLFPVAGGADQKEKNWAVMVGMMQKLGEQETWDARNFQPDAIVGWLARTSEMIAFLREMNPAMNEITYNVVSQSADRAEVEATFGSDQKSTYAFQKIGNIWVVPEVMNSLRQKVDQELKDATTLQMMRTFSGVLPLAIPLLSKLDQAKTKDEFEESLNQPLVTQLLNSLPQQTEQSAASERVGLPFQLPMLPDGIPWFSMGIPVSSGGSSGSSGNN